MLHKLLTAAAVLGTCGVIVTTPALMATQAIAAAPKCKNKANKYVACTDKLRAKTPRPSDVDGRDFLIWQKGGTPSKGGRLRTDAPARKPAYRLAGAPAKSRIHRTLWLDTIRIERGSVGLLRLTIARPHHF